MPHTTQNFKQTASPQILLAILEELKLLREEVKLLLPQEDLEGYANPERIKRSYRKALKKFPPDYSWK